MRGRRTRFAAALAAAAAGRPVAVAYDARRLGVLGALAALFAVAGGALALDGASPLAVRLLGLAGVIAGCAAGAALAYNARLRSEPVVHFDGARVRFRGGLVRAEVAWRDLGGAFIRHHHRQFYVCLVPKDVAAVLAAARPWRRRWLLSNLGTIGAPYSLPTSSEFRAEELFALVRSYAGDLGAGPRPGLREVPSEATDLG